MIRQHLRISCVYIFAIVLSTTQAAEHLVVDSDFEGGSARVIELDENRRFVRIMPAGDPDRGWPAWWCCRILGLREGQTFKWSVVPATGSLPSGHPGGGKPLSAKWALPNRAAWSLDGEHWEQTSAGQRDDAGMTYELQVPSREFWIAWGPLATPRSTQEWLNQAAKRHESVQTFELSKTLEERPVRGIRIASGDKPHSTRPVIWFQARQHAWESGSTWVARGICDWLLSDDPDALWLRKNNVTYIVPIMDVDRVATGDGGKEANPHDHNRDWSHTPHYPEVAAAQARIKKWTAEQRMGVFVDLHNPSPGDEEAYFFIAPDEAIEADRKPSITRFIDMIGSSWQAPIPLDRTEHSTGPDYHPLWHQISTTWVTQHANRDTIAVCLETPWNTPHSHTRGYKQVGATLARGISQYLQSNSNE